MKAEITGVWSWDDNDHEQDYMFSCCERSEVYEMIADEEREKREDETWWDKHIGKDKTIVREFEDEDEIVERFNDEYCDGDLIIADELEYEIIEEDEDDDDEEEAEDEEQHS